MDQGNTGSQIVEPVNIEVTHQTDNQAMDEGEYSGLSLAGALGQPDGESPSTTRMSGEDKKEALTHANSKLRVVVKKTGLTFTPVKTMMSYKQIDACQNIDVLKRHLNTLKFVMQQPQKAKLQVANTELHFRQERLQTAIAIQDEAEQAKVVTVTSIFENELKCGICRQTFINPTVTNCGHTFCRFCINESQWTRKYCPMCNRFVINVTRNYEVISLLDKIASQLPAEAKKAREAQLTTREEEEEASRVARAQQPEETGRDEAGRRSMTRALILQFIEQLREVLPPI
ncbi:unnamed protein product [Orchesella dallaii]|uniref:RING-type domain-containing protein n=1 Tax=Orchesella dallaii TaxID=48710 RepID=A0ABP1RKL2_9HEXA